MVFLHLLLLCLVLVSSAGAGGSVITDVSLTVLPGRGTAPVILSGGAPNGTGDRRNIPGSAGWQTQASIFYRPAASSRVRIYGRPPIKARGTPVGFCFVVSVGRSDCCSRCAPPPTKNRTRTPSSQRTDTSSHLQCKTCRYFQRKPAIGRRKNYPRPPSWQPVPDGHHRSASLNTQRRLQRPPSSNWNRRGSFK
jgi:hypothetical protein